MRIHLCERKRPMSEWESCKLQTSHALQLGQHYWQIGWPTKYHVNIDSQLKPSIVGQVEQQGHHLHTDTAKSE